MVLPGDGELLDLGAVKSMPLDAAFGIPLPLSRYTSVLHSMTVARPPKLQEINCVKEAGLKECIDGPAQMIIVLAGADNRDPVCSLPREHQDLINHDKRSQLYEALIAI